MTGGEHVSELGVRIEPERDSAGALAILPEERDDRFMRRVRGAVDDRVLRLTARLFAGNRGRNAAEGKEGGKSPKRVRDVRANMTARVPGGNTATSTAKAPEATIAADAPAAREFCYLAAPTLVARRGGKPHGANAATNGSCPEELTGPRPISRAPPKESGNVEHAAFPCCDVAHVLGNSPHVLAPDVVTGSR